MPHAITRLLLALGGTALACATVSTPLRAQAAATRADTIHLTLEESLARAYRFSTPVLLAADSVHLSSAQVLEAYGRFLPAAVTGASGPGMPKATP